MHTIADILPRIPVPTSPRVAREIFDCVRRKQGKVDNHQYDSICLRNRYGNKEAFAADVDYLARLKHLRLCLWEASNNQQAEIVLCSTGRKISLHHYKVQTRVVASFPLGKVEFKILADFASVKEHSAQRRTDWSLVARLNASPHVKRY